MPAPSASDVPSPAKVSETTEPAGGQARVPAGKEAPPPHNLGNDYRAANGFEPIRYMQASELIRRQAAERAEHRRRRLELRRWMGYSAARPPVVATPMMAGESYRPAVIVVPFSLRENCSAAGIPSDSQAAPSSR
jgi:hypothetical protein